MFYYPWENKNVLLDISLVAITMGAYTFIFGISLNS